MADQSIALQDKVQHAIAKGERLRIVGSGSYRHVIPCDTSATLLDTRSHTGIIAYQATEMVVTVRSGTPINLLQRHLAKHRQMLGVELPLLSDKATVGGAIAMGYSGVARPFSGAIRDFVLGVRMINGLGEVLSFGGQVMKNVAGYDVSRLLVGSRGALGLILDVSLRVLPHPEDTLSLMFEYSNFSRAVQFTDELIEAAAPVSAATWYSGQLALRFGGRGETIASLQRKLGGEVLGDTWWDDLQAWRFPWGDPTYLAYRGNRRHIPRGDGAWLADWNGAKLWSTAPDLGADRVIKIAKATTYSPLAKRLRFAFDPNGLFV